ncbi:MAG: tRNA glutamyl-Q(34) synthetase GluQRS [Ghiorsea sp.]
MLSKRTRFAPSPTGLLHTGNAYSALLCQQWATAHQAELLLRIEDIDFTRCRERFSKQICHDLNWLDISFAGEVCYQQQRLQHYQKALQQLIGMGVLYPCFCTRKQVKENINPKQRTTLDAYPYTCRNLEHASPINLQKRAFSWRLNQAKVATILGDTLAWSDFSGKEHVFGIKSIGDVIIGRKDIHYSYHLAVVVDDALQGISHVIRGEDLRESTPVHRILQALLAYPSPEYWHHSLIIDHDGKRLAKSKKSLTLQSLQQAKISADDLRNKLLRQP